MTTMQTSTAAVMKQATGAPASAKDAMGELERALEHYETVLAGIEEDIVTAEREGAEAVNAYLVPAAAEINDDVRRLRTDAIAKDTKIKEWQAKFSFVVGTMTERIDPVPFVDPVDPDAVTETTTKRGRR